MTATRLILTAATAAAALVSAVPGTNRADASAAPLQVGATGLVVAVGSLHNSAPASATLVVPQDASLLAGATSGNPALAARTRLTVVRSSDGATLFVGTLATFRALPVTAGTKLEVRVQKPAGYAGLAAAASLRWS